MAEDSFVTSSQRERIQSFREERADHEDTFEARAHMLDSSAIVDTMHEMLDKSEKSLAQTRKREAAAHAHALLNPREYGQGHEGGADRVLAVQD